MPDSIPISYLTIANVIYSLELQVKDLRDELKNAAHTDKLRLLQKIIDREAALSKAKIDLKNSNGSIQASRPEIAAYSPVRGKAGNRRNR